MPEPELFLSGFNVSRSMVLNNYRLDNIVISHNAIKRYNEYAYPIKLDFNWIGRTNPTEQDMKKLYHDLATKVSGIRVIRTPSNRPYECTFFWPLGTEGIVDHSDNYREVDFTFSGYAKRIPEAQVANANAGNWY